MCKIQTLSDDTKSYKPKYEMQDIFKLYGDDYIARNKLNSMQLKAIRDIWVRLNKGIYFLTMLKTHLRKLF